MKSKIISSTLVVLGFVLGATALSALAAWTAPASTPPNCTSGQPGCDAPLHVGSSLQTKLGQLSLNSSGLGAYGLEVVNGIKLIDVGILNGASPTGKVLTSDANGVGTWVALPATVTSPSTVPAGLVVGGYVKSINQEVQSQTYIVNPWGVATGAGCSATYSSVHTGNKLNTSSASAGNFAHEVYLCLTK
ncbi:MAG: hypothetical protein KBC33_00855 [Candidatus Pacebacteria bacterium]|nr:hypothetical protein [Candidatus Paceibacterota bacterium]